MSLLFGQRTVELRSHLNKESVISAIAASADSKEWGFSFSGYRGSADFLVNFRSQDFTLEKRRFYRNSFAPVFTAEVFEDGLGSRIVGRFAMSQGTTAFMYLWLSFALVIGLSIFISSAPSFIHHQNSNQDLVGILVPIGMPIFGILLVMFGRTLGRPEESAILRFLETTASAQVVSADSLQR